MKEETAERICLGMRRISNECQDLLIEVLPEIDPAEVRALKHQFGKVMGAIYFELVRPLCAEFPSIEKQLFPPEGHPEEFRGEGGDRG